MQTPSSARTNVTAPNSPIDLVRSGLAEFATMGIPPSKLVLAQPMFGYLYRCKDVTPPTSGIDCVPEPPFAVDPNGFNHEVGLNTIYGEMIPLSRDGPQWNKTAESPWLDYINRTDGQRRRVWYDDARSIAAKTRLACELNLSGVGAWIGDALPFWDRTVTREVLGALAKPQQCGPPPPPPPQPPPAAPPAPPPSSLPYPPGVDVYRQGSLGFVNFRAPILVAVPGNATRRRAPAILLFCGADKFGAEDWGASVSLVKVSYDSGGSWTQPIVLQTSPHVSTGVDDRGLNISRETHGHWSLDHSAFFGSSGYDGWGFSMVRAAALLPQPLCRSNKKLLHGAVGARQDQRRGHWLRNAGLP